MAKGRLRFADWLPTGRTDWIVSTSTFALDADVVVSFIHHQKGARTIELIKYWS